MSEPEIDLDELIDEAVEETVAEIDTSDEALDADLSLYFLLRNQKDDYTERLKDINADLDVVEARLIKILWEARGIDKIRKDGNTVSVVDEPFPKVLNLEQFILWLDSEGHGGIAKRTVNYNTLRAWVREVKENGGQLPPPELLDDRSGKALRLRRARV